MGNQPLTGGGFPYEILDAPVHTYKSGWILKNGWHKSDKKPVSIFVYEMKPNENDPLAQNFMKRFRTMRHPNLLTFIDGTQVDAQRSLYVVTERVRPLEHILNDLREKKYVISWGLYQIIKAIQFLNDQNFVHGNVGLSSVFVNKQGDWKLGGFEFMSEFSLLSQNTGPIVSSVDRLYPQYLPPELSSAPINMTQVPLHAVDSWMTGCLIFSLFSSSPFVERSQLKQLETVPKDLREQYIQLITANPTRRANVSSVLLKSTYFQNAFIDACLFLEEINVKDAYEKERFFLKLPKLIGEFPEDYCKFKILPHLVKALDFGVAGSIVMEPLLQIAKTLSDEEYNAEVTPSVVKWFRSPDKEIKKNLIENIKAYAQHLSPSLVNDQVYPAVSQGFLDPIPAYRDLTVKAVVELVPKMNVNNINNHLLKCLAKLQQDTEPPIRTNTTICIAKISDYLTPDTRYKVLIPAFTRALKDSGYGPARQAGVQGLISCAKYFSTRDIATRIVPAMSFMSVDPDAEVRSASVNGLKLFVKKIEEGQDSLKFDTPANGVAGVTGGVSGAAAGAIDPSNLSTGAVVGVAGEVLGWALTSLSSKLIGGYEPTTTGQTTGSTGSTGTPVSSPPPQPKLNQESSVPSLSSNSVSSNSYSSNQQQPTTYSNSNNDGFDSHSGFSEDPSNHGSGKRIKETKKPVVKASKISNSWEDEDEGYSTPSSVDANDEGNGWGDDDDSLTFSDSSTSSTSSTASNAYNSSSNYSSWNEKPSVSSTKHSFNQEQQPEDDYSYSSQRKTNNSNNFTSSKPVEPSFNSGSNNNSRDNFQSTSSSQDKNTRTKQQSKPPVKATKSGWDNDDWNDF
eukprot:TRINITY_DN4510_c0_g1_i1.p1 TRINITY_DN4510_c0_g1~~TRINITY_DN4510_c0_g1_i1.p1  ORF type:complete len:848 (-),score=229.52 TRINITY_DN4510_c0_g1_i1:70-2613(-)